MTNQKPKIDFPTETQRLAIACTDNATRRDAEELLKHASPALAPTLYDGVEAALSHDPTAPVLVPVSLPLDYLRTALQAETAPDAALDDWRAETEALLRACRKARRRVLLMDAAMLTAHPNACAEALGERLKLRFDTFPEPKEPVSEPSAIHSVIAATLLAADATALDLLDELEATVLGPVSPSTPSRKEIASATRTVADLREERDLLRENLRQMLEETEHLLNEKTELEGKLEAQNSEIADKHLLKAQLDAVTRQLDEAHAAHRSRESALGAEVLELAARERAARDEIEHIYSSNSWKVTGPLRAARRGLQRP